MEVVIPGRDLDMVSMSNSAASSPRRFSGCYFSAPTSPRKMAEFYAETMKNDMSMPLMIPFDWEEKPGTPKSSPPRSFTRDDDDDDDDDDDFAFDIGGKSETASLFAEELFDGGKIKPLKPPPQLQLDEFEQFIKRSTSPLSSPRSSPRSPISRGKKLLRDAFSPKKKSVDVDPFETAIENTRKKAGEERGRERAHDSKRKVSRSLSPFRVSAFPWEDEDQEQQQEQGETSKTTATSTATACNSKGSSFSSSSGSSMSSKSSLSSKKWSLRNFLLFRSASEGHKDSIKKFYNFFKKHNDIQNSSIRSTGSSDSFSSSSRRRGSSVSAHAFHYIAKKAESQDMKKKTFLPYKRGILGRLAF